jgi:hypothetical protein
VKDVIVELVEAKLFYGGGIKRYISNAFYLPFVNVVAVLNRHNE